MVTIFLDAGNSNIKIALITANKITQNTFSLAYRQTQKNTLDTSILEKYLQQATEISPIKKIFLAASICPNIALQIANICQKYCLSFLELKTQKKFNNIINGYKNYSQLGVDRWLCIIAAYLTHKKPCIIIDLGTAITCDFIDEKGKHLGGLIIPSKSKMQHSLQGTGKIHTKNSDTNLSKYAANNTEDAVNIGIQNIISQFILVEYNKFVALAKLNNWAIEPVLFLTGKGMQSIPNNIINQTNAIKIPNLVFIGMAYVSDIPFKPFLI